MSDRFSAARDVIRDALTHLAVPCAVVEVGDSTRPLWSEAFGALTFSAAASPAQLDTIFDLASLTKVLATASLVMRSVEHGELGLDDPIAAHLSEWRGADRSSITIRDLLSHSSGLPAHRDYYLRLNSVDSYLRAICAEPLDYVPGS